MSESNTFKTSPEPFVPPAVVTLATVGVGLVLVVATFAVDPLGPAFVLLIWMMMLGGLALALVPGRPRSVGVGLALAGAALPTALFVFLLIAVSGGVLLG